MANTVYELMCMNLISIFKKTKQQGCLTSDTIDLRGKKKNIGDTPKIHSNPKCM